MNDKKIGFTIGKFAPLHKGHQLVIETALQEVDELYVVIYDTNLTNISINTRANWIKALYPKAHIIYAYNSPKQYGLDTESVKIQMEYLSNLIKNIPVTHFYSSEPYGEKVANYLHIENRVVDIEKKQFPISASAIRNNIQNNKNYLEEIVYNDLQKEIAKRYNRITEHLKNKFGERTLKICIDGGFTCPNRDGSCGTGGCIFCGERGSGEHLTATDIKSQVTNFLSSYRGKRANKFIVYFQNFTNTYDTPQHLKEKYDAALTDHRIVGIAIATRPDCINEEIIKLLKSYSEKYYVWVELGLQTSNDTTAKLINRGYPASTYTEAVNLLNQYGIDVVTHIMVGLPGENFDDLKNTVSFINSHNIQGLKIHSTYVTKDTSLEKMYLNGNYTPLTLEEYMKSLTYVLTHISKDIVIHRISGDAPKNLLVAPEWNLHKKLVLNGIDKVLKEDNLYQGIYYKKNIDNT